MFACENDSPANIEICRLILGGMSTVMRRYRMLIDQDSQGWNSLHFASKSGVFTKLPWDSLLGGEIYAKMHLHYHRKTMEGLTILHISAWTIVLMSCGTSYLPMTILLGAIQNIWYRYKMILIALAMGELDNYVNFTDRQSASRTKYVSVPLAQILRQMPPNQLLKSKMTELDVAVASGYYGMLLCVSCG